MKDWNYVKSSATAKLQQAVIVNKTATKRDENAVFMILILLQKCC